MRSGRRWDATGSRGVGGATCRGPKWKPDWWCRFVRRTRCPWSTFAATGLRIGAPSAVAHDGNHAASRALSAAVHGSVPEADGFLFTSRSTGDLCVAVFDRAFGRLRAGGTAELVRHAEFLDDLDEYDIVLTGPPA